MPASHRSFSFPRATAVVLPLLTGLGGCVAAPLLQLAAAPASQAVPCATGGANNATPGCNAGATGSMIPGMASLMQVISPAAPASAAPTSDVSDAH
jgi:hypothetical protein